MPRMMRVSNVDDELQHQHPKPQPALSPYFGIYYYLDKIHADSTTFVCPHCDASLTSGDFEEHVSTLHELDPERCCVWCNGFLSWQRPQQKQKHVRHLLTCWRSFLATVTSPLLLPEPSTASNDPLLPPPPTEYVWDLPDRAFDMVWLLPVKPRILSFQDAALKPAVSAVHIFLDFTNSSNASTSSSSSSSTITTTTQSSFGSTTTSFDSTTTRSISSFTRSSSKTAATPLEPLEWFHVTVTRPAYRRFLDVMDRYEGDFCTLPFSCWCLLKMDGSCHRHFVVVAKPSFGFARNVVHKLFIASSIFVVRIDTVLELIDVMGDLGNQRRLKNWCPFPSGGRIKAYYAIVKLPTDFRLVLLMQWNNGVLQDDQFKNVDSRNKGKHMIDLVMRALMVISRNDFIVCEYPTEYALHLFWGEKVYFKRKLSNCSSSSDRAWRIRESNALTPAAVVSRGNAESEAAEGPTGSERTGAGKTVKLKKFPFKVSVQNELNTM